MHVKIVAKRAGGLFFRQMADQAHGVLDWAGKVGAALSRAPLEFGDLAVRLVSGVHAAQLESNAFLPQGGMDPARWQARTEDVGYRRQIDQVNAALVLPKIPGVRSEEHTSE